MNIICHPIGFQSPEVLVGDNCSYNRGKAEKILFFWSLKSRKNNVMQITQSKFLTLVQIVTMETMWYLVCYKTLSRQIKQFVRVEIVTKITIECFIRWVLHSRVKNLRDFRGNYYPFMLGNPCKGIITQPKVICST